MARRALVWMLLVATSAALVACSSGGSAPEAEPATAADSGTDAPPPTSTTTSSPRSTTPAFRSSPACDAFARYKLAELTLGTGTDEQKRLAVEAIANAFDDLRQLLPQYRTELDQQYDLLRRSLAGTATDADRAGARKALVELDTWYRATCLEPASTTTRRP